VSALAWLFPDAMLRFLVHAAVVLGLVLSVVGAFISRLPVIEKYGTLIKILGAVLLVGGVYFSGWWSNEASWQEKIAEAERKVRESEVVSVEATVVVQKVFVDRVKVVKEKQIVIQEKIVEVEKIINAECKVAPEAIKILNDAARKVVK